MKKILVCCLLFVVGSFSVAQQNTFNKEAELQKFVEHGGKVEETSPNIYKLTYRDGSQRVFNFNHSEELNNKPADFTTTVINVWEIDTTLYANKFRFWQDAKVVNGTEGRVFVEDINNNGLLELYGITRTNWPFGGQVDILEQDNQGIFHIIYSYDSTSIFVQGMGDIDSDGIKEVHLRTTDTLNGKFYKADSLGVLPTSFDFVFYYFPNQIQNETFSDLDKNKLIDCLFIDGNTPSKVIVSEFRKNLNNFETIFEMTIEMDVPVGFSVGDFDQDRKTEIVFGTALQKVYVIEAEDTNQYSVVWKGVAPTYSAYMHTKTNDIDGNGKPEFWVGGQNFETGISTFWCYEADGNNNYIPVAGIELRYLLSLTIFYIQSEDMDNDGKEELIINLGNHLLILKFAGKPNQQTYELYYAKINEQSQPGVEFQPVTVFDFNADTKKDILLPMVKYSNLNLFSYILVQNELTTVVGRNMDILEGFNIEQNYPNPFNPSTKITFELKEQQKVRIAVYNLLGKEIKTLINKPLSPGEYNIQWNGDDNEDFKLPNGVYFIQMVAGSYQKTIKAVLLK